jgi:hypothetical protein
MTNKVFASFENEYSDHCVDIFERPDCSFGCEEFRRDVEDCGAWQSLARHSQQVFGSEPLALAAASESVKWRSRRIFTWHSWPRIAGKSKRSTARL